jgi:Ca-activated chloride channel family protein
MKKLAVAVVAGLLVAGCSGDVDLGQPDPVDPTAEPTPTTADLGGDPGDCVVVDVAVSSEKIALITELARVYNEADNQVGGRCVFVRPRSKASGAAATLLTQGWPEPEANGEPPVIWSPAASGWGAIVNQRLDDQGQPPVATESRPFMLTPLVIAMPEPMADALGYPETPIGFADIVALAEDPEGWAKFGHPEWGPFRLGKTNPNFSTSGLNFTVAQYYAATGKTSDLTVEDLERPEVEAFAEGVESSVVHYGDITMTFLNNWFRADARGTALTYVSAVAVEEKSIIDYNAGNPDGVLAPGEEPRPPKVPLVAVYPREGTLYSDNPLIVLDAPWVDEAETEAARSFTDFVLRPENQAKVLEFGFRPGNPSVPVAAPIVAANGVDPDQPQAVLDVPEPDVLVRVLDKWAEQRKTARVMLVIDVSGSMAEEAAAGSSDTKLDLAKRAAIASLDEFKDDDEVGLRIFSTDLPDGAFYLDLLAVAPIGPQRQALADRIDGLVPVQGTPLYDVTAASYTAMVDTFDPALINAIVLLTDGRNDDGIPEDDQEQLDGLLDGLRVGSEGVNTTPVRIFPIAYGADADLATLRRIAEATNAAAYDASNPDTIEQVFTAVVSNF